MLFNDPINNPLTAPQCYIRLWRVILKTSTYSTSTTVLHPSVPCYSKDDLSPGSSQGQSLTKESRPRENESRKRQERVQQHLVIEIWDASWFILHFTFESSAIEASHHQWLAPGDWDGSLGSFLNQVLVNHLTSTCLWDGSIAPGQRWANNSVFE